MKRNERLALSSFSVASITSGNIAPSRRPSCHQPGFGGNVRPVYLRALTLSDTPGVDGEGGYFLLEDLDTLHLHQLVKPIAAHKQVSGRDLPVTARKQRPARPRLAPNLQQSARPPSRAIYRSAYSSPLRGPPGLSSKIKTSDLTGWSSSLGGNRIRSGQIQVSRALQDTWKILKAANRPNVHISMLYLGTGSKVSTQNPNHQVEVKVFQQICGAENICVYKGHLVHREQFQFVSRRHFGFPFSATIYVNRLVAARISWCCEHKYPVGFQLGKRSCFRLMGIRGGIPCHRCLMAWPYQGHGSKQRADAMQPGRETAQDERPQQASTPHSRQLERSAMSKSSFLRSDVGENKMTMSDGSSSNSNHKALTSMKIPASSGASRWKSSHSCDTGQRNINAKSAYLFHDALNTKISSQILESDSGGRTYRRNNLMRRICQGAERMDNTACSRKQVNQESSSESENARRKLFEDQRRSWKKDTSDAGGGSSDQESGDSGASRKGGRAKKKIKRKRGRKREAREEIGTRFGDRADGDDGKKTRGRGRRLKKGNNLEDQIPVSVTQRDAVEDEFFSVVDATMIAVEPHQTHPPTSWSGQLQTPIQEQPASQETGETGWTAGSPTDTSKAEPAARVRVKLASALKRAEATWPEAEHSVTSEASGGENRKQSEKGKKPPAHGGQPTTYGEADEFGQCPANIQTRIKGTVCNTPASLAGRKTTEEAASSDSILQRRTKPHHHMKPAPAQNDGSLLETNSHDPLNNVGMSSKDCLNGSQDCTCFPVTWSEKISGENVSSQRPNALKRLDEQNYLQVCSEAHGHSCSITKPRASEDKQILTGYKTNVRSRDDPPWPHQLPSHCNRDPDDGHNATKSGRRRSQDGNVATEELPGKLVSENKNNIARLSGSTQDHQAVDALRKQVADVITVLTACKSVGELIMRNTGLTDDLLETLVIALVNHSQSQVETINLNINNLGPHGAELLVELLKAKPSIKCLLLHGNNLGDKGISILMHGLIDLLLAENAEETKTGSGEGEHSDLQRKRLQLTELDIGSNQLTNEGLKCVALFLSMNPPLEYLGLSRNDGVDLTGWRGLFDILKDCRHISHLLLDENVLRNEGAKYFAKMLRVNRRLCKVDLDGNGIGDEGGLALCEALSSDPGRFLRYLSLDGNELSSGVKRELNAILAENNQG